MSRSSPMADRLPPQYRYRHTWGQVTRAEDEARPVIPGNHCPHTNRLLGPLCQRAGLPEWVRWCWHCQAWVRMPAP